MFETFAGNRPDLDEFVLQNSLNLRFTSSRSSNLKNSCKIGHKVYIKYTSARDWHSCIVVSTKITVVHCFKMSYPIKYNYIYIVITFILPVVYSEFCFANNHTILHADCCLSS